MKNKLYILTCCIMLAMGLNMISQVADFISGFNAGINSSRDNKENGKVESLFIAIRPLRMVDKPTLLYNVQSGEWMPGRIQNCIIKIEIAGNNIGFVIFEGVLILLAFLCFPAALVMLTSFIKIILSVGKNHVFEWKNIKRIRKVGACFLFIFLFSFSTGLYNYLLANTLIDIPGYKITLGHMLDISYLLFGLVALIIVEVYSIGLKLKEEEELTI
ncbi:MAG: DUF2975 domain-containing protein [Tannerellaceae bacterium]|nr:DUF2975 domain-containing protein [Tannerellaceae bacterium]